MTVGSGLLESLNGESPDGKGTTWRETVEERGWAENGAAARRKPERIRGELLNENGPW